jgi:hypothetical protein
MENAEEDSDEDDDSSNSDGDVNTSSDHEETSPKVDITGCDIPKLALLGDLCKTCKFVGFDPFSELLVL